MQHTRVFPSEQDLQRLLDQVWTSFSESDDQTRHHTLAWFTEEAHDNLRRVMAPSMLGNGHGQQEPGPSSSQRRASSPTRTGGRLPMNHATTPSPNLPGSISHHPHINGAGTTSTGSRSPLRSSPPTSSLGHASHQSISSLTPAYVTTRPHNVLGSTLPRPRINGADSISNASRSPLSPSPPTSSLSHSSHRPIDSLTPPSAATSPSRDLPSRPPGALAPVSPGLISQVEYHSLTSITPSPSTTSRSTTTNTPTNANVKANVGSIYPNQYYTRQNNREASSASSYPKQDLPPRSAVVRTLHLDAALKINVNGNSSTTTSHEASTTRLRAASNPFPSRAPLPLAPQPILPSTTSDFYRKIPRYSLNHLYNSSSPSDSVQRSPASMLRKLADYDERGEHSVGHTSADGGEESAPLQAIEERVNGEGGGDGGSSLEVVTSSSESLVNVSLLSRMALHLRDNVPREDHTKGGVRYERAFTGKDIVATLHSAIQLTLNVTHGSLPPHTQDRSSALQVARSLQSHLFFTEVEWDSKARVQDNVEDVYNFLSELMVQAIDYEEDEDLPMGVVTTLTPCYSPLCDEDSMWSCYSYSCPRKRNSNPIASTSTFVDHVSAMHDGAVPTNGASATNKKTWAARVGPEITQHLSFNEIRRQNIIHSLIDREAQYVQALDDLETNFIIPLKNISPPILQSDAEGFVSDVFGGLKDIGECSRRLVETMYVRHREEGPVVRAIGDVVFEAVVEFMTPYPEYIKNYPTAEKRLKDEIEKNFEFRLFVENASRLSSHNENGGTRFDLKHFLNRPSEHIHKLPHSLNAILKLTDPDNGDYEALEMSLKAVKSLQSAIKLATFQASMGRGAPGKWEWHDLVSDEARERLSETEAKRQAIMFELIKGEMAYVRDLESIENMYITPLRTANPPIILKDKLESFIQDVFHNYRQILDHHKVLLREFHRLQNRQHPKIESIIKPLTSAVLQFREAYQQYIPNYPIAAHRINEGMANNLSFKTFVESRVRHPDAHRLDMKNFINRPIPRLLRYELLLKAILEVTPKGSKDLEQIPETVDLIKSLGKETEPGVIAAKQKAEVWRYQSDLVFKPGETNADMDLLNEGRSLVHSGRLFRQPESGEWNGWTELFVLLFDNYLVMTRPRERDGNTKYSVVRKPMPLDLLTLVSATDPPFQRSTGILRGLRDRTSDEVASLEQNDSRIVYPLTLHYQGRDGGSYVVYSESAQARIKWKEKLEEAISLRKVIQESQKLFTFRTLNAHSFVLPPFSINVSKPGWNQDNAFTGSVTCSVPFTISRGSFLAIGCDEGVFIGLLHDPKSMRLVLQLKSVRQCALLEEFGIFLVLADKSLFAYQIEALVTAPSQNQHSHASPRKLNGKADVQFFSVGNIKGRTLVIYMKKKNSESVFCALEPIGDKINDISPISFNSRLGFRHDKADWFRVYKDFRIPSESYDIFFLKTQIVILCAKSLVTVNLDDLTPVPIIQFKDPRLPLAKRCEASRAIGMFRSNADDYLVCYDEFGLYIDQHGFPIRQEHAIDWEGTAEHVAFHSPYIILFNSQFLEIRHITNGRLTQIIRGNDVRCIWDGRASSTASQGHDHSIQKAQVYAVINSMPRTSAVLRSQGVRQYVVELLPTLPLASPRPNGIDEYVPTAGPMSPYQTSTGSSPILLRPVR